MSDIKQFKTKNTRMIKKMGKDKSLNSLSKKFINNSSKYEYSYHFSWLGRPIIQYPQDMIAIQEIIWKYKPDFIIETGIAHGGSLILSASILAAKEDSFTLFKSESPVGFSNCGSSNFPCRS